MPIDIRSWIVFEKHYALACKREIESSYGWRQASGDRSRVYDEILNHSNRNAYTFRFDFLIICDNTFCKKGIINRVLSTE